MSKTSVGSSRVRRIIAAIPRTSVMVIGDAMLDEYLWGDVSRISPEAPVPIVEIASSSTKLGGAANVACNLASLGVRTHLVAVCGTDANGRRLRSVMRAQGLSADGLVATGRRPTTVKTRIIAQHQQIVRVDHEERGALSAAECRALVRKALARLPGVAAVIFSDYAKGTVVAQVLEPLIAACRRRGTFVAVDPKKRFFEEYAGAHLITPNLREAHQALGLPYRRCSREETRVLGWKLVDQLQLPTLLITMGEDGMALFEAQGRRFHHLDTVARKVFDVTGAGDTVISVYTAAIAAGATPAEAAFLANHAAGLTVAQVGTATVTCDDLLRECARR